MKLVYITSESFLDHSYTIVKELQKRCEMKIFIQAKDRTGELTNWCNILQAVFVQRRRFRNPLAFFSELGFMNRVKKMKPDIVWFNALTAFQILIVRIMLKNFLVNVHDIEFHPGWKDFHSFLFLWLTFKLLRKNICVVSKTQADLFQRKYGYKPLVFQLPIIDYYKDIGESLSNYPKRNERTGDCAKFFFFGTIEPYKGIEILIDAVDILLKRNVTFELNIYGKLKYSFSELTGRINKLKRVKLFNEFIDYKDVHKIYSENDILILPYKQVTQCGPLLIGYCEGVPSICNDLPGFREYVVDGKSGIIFNGTPGDLADKMERIIKNGTIKKEFREYINTGIYEKFSMEKLADNYINGLKNV